MVMNELARQMSLCSERSLTVAVTICDVQETTIAARAPVG
jgi:hypothetical protein